MFGLGRNKYTVSIEAKFTDGDDEGIIEAPNVELSCRQPLSGKDIAERMAKDFSEKEGVKVSPEDVTIKSVRKGWW